MEPLKPTYEVFACGSPNVTKVALCLAELGQDWEEVWIDVTRGEQHRPAFLEVTINGRVPVLVDYRPADGGDPVKVWESGAILLYLSEKHGRFVPDEPRARAEVMTWLFWQMASLGPMSGQNAHFVQYEPPESDYSQHRYHAEVERLYRVLDRQLDRRDFICRDYSIADMACYPWIRYHRFLRHDMSALPALSAWAERMAARPAVVTAYERMARQPISIADTAERWNAMKPDRGLEALIALEGR